MGKASKKPKTAPWSAISRSIDKDLEEFTKIKFMISQIQKEPHWMDDATVDGMCELYQSKLARASQLDKDLEKYARIPGHRKEISRMLSQLAQCREDCRYIIEAFQGMKGKTRDAVARMSDREYQEAVRSGQIPDMRGRQTFTKEQLEIASLVAKRTKALLMEGVKDDAALVYALRDLVPDLRRILLNTATPAMMEELCNTHDGFHHFILALFGRGLPTPPSTGPH
jgi:hypothetical protein